MTLAIAGLAAGWLIADFLSGLLHWLEDRLGSETTPIVGRHIIAPNRLHHRRPNAFLGPPFWVRSSTTWLFAGALAALWLAVFGPSWVWVGALAGGILSAEVHAWSHERKVPAIVSLLQELGIFQSPAHHGRHHRPPRDTHFCVLTNFLNPFLDRARFWRGLETAAGILGAEIYRENDNEL